MSNCYHEYSPTEGFGIFVFSANISHQNPHLNNKGKYAPALSWNSFVFKITRSIILG